MEHKGATVIDPACPARGKQISPVMAADLVGLAWPAAVLDEPRECVAEVGQPRAPEERPGPPPGVVEREVVSRG